MSFYWQTRTSSPLVPTMAMDAVNLLLESKVCTVMEFSQLLSDFKQLSRVDRSASSSMLNTTMYTACRLKNKWWITLNTD